MPVLRKVVNMDDELLGYTFMCPGCKNHHTIHTERKATNGAIWRFDGNMDHPTFSPSIKCEWTIPPGWDVGDEVPNKTLCHSFIRNGIWEFLNDCTHELAGQKVPMIEVDQ